jgi:1,4-dihydroxy-2-naphthoate polyprenyltransferase
MTSDIIEKKPTKCKAWILASRPKTLGIGIIPIITGTALGLHNALSFHWILMLSALISSMLIQISVNLINDALDFKKGADTSMRLGFKRATQQGWLMYHEVLYGAFFCIFLAFLTGIPMIIYGGAYFLALLIIAPTLSYCYTGGPFPLAYHGMGELFVIIFFGFVSTLVGFYLQAFMVSKGALLAGLQLGLLAAVVIATNNLRDIETDAKANKKTLAVLTGKTFARLEITLMILLPYFLNLLWSDLGFYKAGLLPLVSLPLGFTLVRCIWHYEPSKIYNTFFGMAALLNFLFGLFLSIGFWL